MNTHTEKGNDLLLPEIEVRKTLGLRLVNKAASLTFLILAGAVAIALIIVFSVSMEVTIDANGLLEPAEIHHIHSSAAGIIKEVYVKSGDSVRTGQVLAILDSLQIKQNLIDVKAQIASKENELNRQFAKISFDTLQNRYNLQKSQAQLLKAKATFRDRLLSYFPHSNIDSIAENYRPGTHITLDYAMADIHSAETDINSGKLAIAMQKLKKYDLNDLRISLDQLYDKEKILKEELKRVVIKSPSNGIVLTEGIDGLVNTYVSQGGFLFDISEMKGWDAVLFVGERDIHSIKIGDKVKVELNALESTKNYELLNAEVISVAEEQNSGTERYKSFDNLYRVTARIINLKNTGQNVSELKYGYKLKGKVITDYGRIVDLIIRYFRRWV